MTTEPDPTDAFADLVRNFCEWAENGEETGAVAMADALRHVTRLFHAAIDLPSLTAQGCIGDDDVELVSNHEFRAVYRNMARLEIGFYGVVYDPSVVPPEEPVVGDIADDIADIYRNVLGGLRHHDAGRRADALWEWTFQFQLHWGGHATSAMHVLYRWLHENGSFGELHSG